MQTTLLIVLVCAAIDLIASGFVLAAVWMVHRRMRIEAAATEDETMPSAAGQFAFLIAFGLIGLVGISGSVWLLLRLDD